MKTAPLESALVESFVPIALAAVCLPEVARAPAGDWRRKKLWKASAPVYNAVTEGRHDAGMRWGVFYSSCGDLPHWLAAAVGLREPWINRAEVEGCRYRVGQNISLLEGEADHADELDPASLRAGDFMLIWDHPKGRDAHVMVCAGTPREDKNGQGPAWLVRVGEYGQPGGNMATKRLVSAPAGWRVQDGRSVRRVLRFGPLVERAGLTAATVAANLTAELDRIGATSSEVTQ